MVLLAPHCLCVPPATGVTFLVCEPSKRGKAAAGQAADHEPRLCVPLHVEEGLVFELNNRLAHSVTNGDQPRIHLVIDVAESARPHRQLRVGEVCSYGSGKIVCPPEEKEEEGKATEDAEEAHGGGDTLRRAAAR